MQRWYVVQAQPNGEERAIVNLERQGFESYLPRITKRRRQARRVQMVRRPLFPRYLFVHLDISAQRWRPILSTFGVSTLIRLGNDPTPVPDGMVEALQDRERDGSLIEVPATARFKEGQEVEVREGPFSDLIGRFVRMADQERIVVLLNTLGRQVQTTLPADYVSAR